MVTIPTLDEIAGSTVMIKMRELIKKFIGFAGEVNTELSDRYTKGEVDTKVADITGDVDALETRVDDLNEWKSNTATPKFNSLENNVASLNGSVTGLDGRIDGVEDTLVTKQDILTAGDNITIENNVISAVGGGGWKIYESTDWSALIDINKRLVKDVLIYYEDVQNSHNVITTILPKGTYFNNNTLYIGQIIISGNYYSCYIYASLSTITSYQVEVRRYFDNQVSPQYTNGIWKVELNSPAATSISKSTTFDYPYNSPYITLLVSEE